VSFEIRVNGKKFELWETASVQRSIDANSGAFRFTSSNTTPARYPVKAGDKVQVVVNGKPKITGFAERVIGRMDDDTHTVEVSGRDNTCDLIDSSVPDAAKNIPTPVSMVGMCEKVIADLGADIEVVNSIGSPVLFEDSGDEFSFEADVGVSADAGKSCIDYLTSFARKKQVYLVASGDGRLLVYRPGLVRASSSITHEINNTNNNVKNYSVSFDHQNRFRTYKVSSQDNFGFLSDYEDDSTSRGGEATDSAIRESRFLNLQSEESMGNSESGNRAVEEANVRKARSTDYKVTVVGVSQKNGELWDFGQLVSVKDDFAGIRGIMLIRSVEYSVDILGGTNCIISMAPPEAYNVRIDNETDTRRARQGNNLQRQTPDTSVRFQR
tara:strand:- start:44874 stop:46022 length:1149 start_codon:yes stop_codon:yes gene_type:complete